MQANVVHDYAARCKALVAAWRVLRVVSCFLSLRVPPSCSKMLQLGAVKQRPRCSAAFTAFLKRVRHLRRAPSRSPAATLTRVSRLGGLLGLVKCGSKRSGPPASRTKRLWNLWTMMGCPTGAQKARCHHVFFNAHIYGSGIGGRSNYLTTFARDALFSDRPVI